VLISTLDGNDRILAYEEMRRNVIRESATADREHRTSLYNVQKIDTSLNIKDEMNQVYIYTREFFD